MSELDLDCNKCSESQKRLYGCTAPPTSPSTWAFKDGFLDRCPMRYITKETAIFIKYYGFFKQGFLVNAGALGHQPSKMIDAFAIIDDEKYLLSKEQEEKRR